MNPLNNNDDCEFAKYFKNLGYDYSWDFSKRDGLYWHELGKCGIWFLQVEMVDLNRIIKDMCATEEFKTDYFLAGYPSEITDFLYKELCDKVREFEKNKK